ncbi:uncharacterized protein LOC126549631 isoform X2 [Aphis gossypii]|uniref:uncharacterized protein LOC126549631 isoform X2 n=1 Tax=Aphis gossypii TaxID=80765 RepID=UPI002158D479|nr:uncharacterized protein LOC126549631 isoform X2 [Aphis gossypii]
MHINLGPFEKMSVFGSPVFSLSVLAGMNTHLELVGPTNVMLPESSSRGTYFKFQIGTVDYRHLKLLEKNALYYVCGYLYTYTNTAQTTYGNLQMPENDFYEYIYENENIIIERFPMFTIANY